MIHHSNPPLTIKEVLNYIQTPVVIAIQCKHGQAPRKLMFDISTKLYVIQAESINTYARNLDEAVELYNTWNPYES